MELKFDQWKEAKLIPKFFKESLNWFWLGFGLFCGGKVGPPPEKLSMQGDLT